MDYSKYLTRFFAQSGILPETLVKEISAIYGKGLGNLSHSRKKDPDGLHFGIEIEVEGVNGDARELIAEAIGAEKAMWSLTEDTSLRDNGVEFVSHPLRYNDLAPQLAWLYSKLPAKAKFNRRAGIHIHSNVSDLRLEQYIAIVVLYSMIERALFMTVAEHRNNNIYCVPLYRSGSYVDAIKVMRSVPTVGKYAALNILPVRQYGTIEFRHFESTNDVAKIKSWLEVIADLQRYVRKNIGKGELISWLSSVLELRTTSEFIEFLHGVLSHDSFEFLYGETTALETMEVGVNRALSEIAAGMSGDLLPVTPILKKYS